MAFDFAAEAVWTLTIEQKYLHFDSRIFLKSSALKKFILNSACIYWLVIRNSPGISEIGSTISIIIAFTSFFIDRSIHYYNQRFKNFLIMLDLCCILSAALPLIFEWFGKTISLSTHVTLIVINVWAAAIYSKIAQQNYDILFQINPWEKKIDED